MLAGVWAYHAHKQGNILEQGDIAEGLNAAASVGDDRMLSMAGRSVNPNAFTHGISEKRARWFQKDMRLALLVSILMVFAFAARDEKPAAPNSPDRTTYGKTIEQ